MDVTPFQHHPAPLNAKSDHGTSPALETGRGKIGGASYLVWLDSRGLGLDHDALVVLFVDKAHLALDDGEMFGSGGEGFMRLNAGTTRARLRRALDALALAVRSL